MQCVGKVDSNNVNEINRYYFGYNVSDSGEVTADSENILSPHLAFSISKPIQQKQQDSEVCITYCGVSKPNAEIYIEKSS